MTEQTFKVGDRVRITKTYSHGGVLTYEGTVHDSSDAGTGEVYTEYIAYTPNSGVPQTIEKIAPAEPKGLGAVVKDHDDEILVRIGDHPMYCWSNADGDTCSWSDLNVVEVLSEGIVVE